MTDIIYTINQGKTGQILAHLAICDKEFIPPLSQRVDLTVYAEKLVRNATNFEAWNDKKEMIGLISIYMNDLSLKVAFITSVSVLPEYIGKGVAKYLMIECLKETTQRGFELLQLEVNKLSEPAIKLYRAYGFQIYDINKETFKMNLKLKTDDKE